LVAAIALRPMLARVPAERSLRSLSVQFVGPLAAAPAECRTELLREGRALTAMESRIVQDGQVRCIAQANFAADRASSAELAPPAAPAGLDPRVGVEMPYVEGRMPGFIRHFVTRWDNGAFPGSSSVDGHVIGACRFANEAREAELCDVIALLDVWPPATTTMLKGFTSASTVSWTIDFPCAAWAGTTDAFWGYEVRVISARGGYGQTEAWLWDPQGRAVARSVQLVAVYE
jgi:acyl-CoA thioesterase